MMRLLGRIPRFVATPRVAKHRTFAWLDARIVPDSQIIVIARVDDTTFGLLHSADTAGPTETLGSGVILPTVAAGSRAHALAIAAAHRLNELRDTWLNPPEWTERIPEIVPGYPDRIRPRSGHEADLKQRTLTNLYNVRPAWLDQAHRAFDAAVAAAYGWEDYTPDLPDAEILRRRLALNLERAG